MDRAGFRSKTIGSQKHFRKTEVELDEGLVAEVRQPSVNSRAAIFRAARALSGRADEMELAELQVEAVINCTFVLGTEERVFEKGDRESLLSQPTGGWFDKLSEAALELLNVDEKDLRKK